MWCKRFHGSCRSRHQHQIKYSIPTVVKKCQFWFMKANNKEVANGKCTLNKMLVWVNFKNHKRRRSVITVHSYHSVTIT